MKVEFYRHQLNSEEMLPAIGEVLDSLFLTTGPKTGRFEEELSRYLGVKRTVGLSSCTAGLFLCLTAWDISPGDEVIVPAMTFVATANAVLQTGAVPVFADIDPATGIMDIADAERKITSRTKAIIPVHLYGRMADMKRFRALADKHGLRLLEDAAHCVEGIRDGVRPGQLGDAVCFSFYATKNITCGEGGAVSTNDDVLADRVTVLRLHGMDRDAAKRHMNYKHWDMIELGYKFNMNDIQAAMLIPQLARIDEFHAMRKRVYDAYIERFSALSMPVSFPAVDPMETHAHHLFVVRVPSGVRDALIAHFREKEIGVTVNYRAVHLNSYYCSRLGTKPGQCPRAEAMGEEVISLPFYPSLDTKSIDYVVEAMNQFFAKEDA